MNDYVSRLCEKYKIGMTEEALNLFRELFKNIEFIVESEVCTRVEYGDLVHSVDVKYGSNMENILKIYFHLYKFPDQKLYRIGSIYGDLFFFYNEELYVIDNVDVDELDEESIQFETKCYSKETLAPILSKATESGILIPDHLFFNDIKPDQEAIYTRYMADCDPDFISIALDQIKLQKEDPTRARTQYSGN